MKPPWADKSSAIRPIRSEKEKPDARFCQTEGSGIGEISGMVRIDHTRRKQRPESNPNPLIEDSMGADH